MPTARATAATQSNPQAVSSKAGVTIAQHTPGPWVVESGELVQRESPVGWFVCHPKTECDATALCWLEHEADARLISAAPELLAACEALLERYRIMVAADGIECLQAIAAIAKARNTSPTTSTQGAAR
jgi:hypothetical protein